MSTTIQADISAAIKIKPPLVPECPTATLLTWEHGEVMEGDFRESSHGGDGLEETVCSLRGFSLRAIAFLAAKSGFVFPEEMSLLSRLAHIQAVMREDDDRAEAFYESVGMGLAYSIVHYIELHPQREVFIHGILVRGQGGEIISRAIERILRSEFPLLAEKLSVNVSEYPAGV